MCDDCRKHRADSIREMVEKARPDQIRRLLADILRPPPDPGETPA